jgi:enterochelin esterase-like enzyme
VPFVGGPYAELGHGDAELAPTLVRDGEAAWRLSVGVRGLTTPPPVAAFFSGVRPIEPSAFKRALGIRLDDSLDVSVQVTLPRREARLDLTYYSGWQEVAVRIFDGGIEHAVPLVADGPGRVPGEQRWRGELPVGRFGRDWGFVLRGPNGAIDRPPGGGAYRPLGSRVHLADGEIFAAAPPQHRSPPRIETLAFPAPEMEHTFTVHVVLPRDFDAYPTHRYPLVYLNDGQNQLTNRGAFGGWHTDTIAARLMREGRLEDCVLACVEMHADRNRAYFPEGTLTTAIGQADVYTDLLAGRLFALLKSRYHLSTTAPLAIVGSSNGAIHALSAGLTRPERFALIGCLSYARLRPERNFRQIESAPEVPFARAYVDSGTRWDDRDSEETSDDNVGIAYGLRERLLARGMVLEDTLRYVLARGDAHNEAAWRRRIGDALSFLLPPA